MDKEKSPFADFGKMFEHAQVQMEKAMNMLPKAPPISVKLDEKKATACMLKDGRILIEFESAKDAEEYFAGIGKNKRKSFWDFFVK